MHRSKNETAMARVFDFVGCSMLQLNWGGRISCGVACKVSMLFGLKLARVSDRFKGPRRKCKFFYMVTGRQWLDASPKGLQLGKPAECLNAHVMLVVCDQGFGQQNYWSEPFLPADPW